MQSSFKKMDLAEMRKKQLDNLSKRGTDEYDDTCKGRSGWTSALSRAPLCFADFLLMEGREWGRGIGWHQNLP